MAQAWAGPIRRGVNPTMYPLSPTGPYYAVLLGAGTLDSSGGPETTPRCRPAAGRGDHPGPLRGRQLRVGADGQGYLGGGGTIGPALVFGWIAGQSAANRTPVEAQ